MEIWEDKKLMEKYRRLSREKSLLSGIELTETALHIMKDSLHNDYPSLSESELNKKIHKLLWDK